MPESVTVLHVDDDNDFLKMAATFLERTHSDLDILTAESAEAGLDTLESNAIDCIVSDYDMPEMDGLEFLDAVRDDHPSLPFILFTGTGSEEVASDAISAGVTDYLQKSTGRGQYELLANRIDNAVNQYRAEQRAATIDRRLRELTEATDDVFWMFNAAWEELLFVNSAYEEMWGQSVSDLRSDAQSFIDGIHPADRDHVQDAMATLSSGEPVELEYRVNESEDYQRWVWVKGVPLTDDDGNVKRVAGFVRDISDRKRREELLQQYEVLVENMDDAVFMFDADGTCTFVDATTVEATPYTRDELVGGPVSRLVDLGLTSKSPEYETYTTAVEAVLAGEREEARVTLEVAGMTDGSNLTDIQLSRVEDDDGELVGVVGVARDVSDQHQRKRELEARNEAIQAATDGIAIVGPDGQYSFVNQAHADIYGYDNPDAFIDESWEMCYGDDELDRFETAVMPTIEETGSWRGEATGQRRDGSTFPQELSLTLMDRGQLICVVRDITDRKHREAELRTEKSKIEALHEVATRFSACETRESVYDELVAAAQEILEYDIVIVDEAQGQVLVPQAHSTTVDTEQYFDETPIFANDNIAAEVYRTGEPSVVDDLVETDVTPADSEFRSALTVPIGNVGVFQTVSKSPGAYGNSDLELVEILVAHARETVARLQEEEKLRNRSVELEQKNDRLDEFASLVSHDLRNPLNLAQGHLDLAREEVSSDHLDTVADAHHRMDELIGDLMALTRHGDQVTETEPVSLGDVVRRSWATIETGDVELDVAVDDWWTVEADESRLQQLVDNVVGNAVEEDVSVVTVGALEDGFFIADDGPGIEDTDQDVIFEAGYSTREEGSGLGLAIVHQIAEAHGWTVSVTDGESGGARFEFRGVGED